MNAKEKNYLMIKFTTVRPQTTLIEKRRLRCHYLYVYKEIKEKDPRLIGAGANSLRNWKINNRRNLIKTLLFIDIKIPFIQIFVANVVRTCRKN